MTSELLARARFDLILDPGTDLEPTVTEIIRRMAELQAANDPEYGAKAAWLKVGTSTLFRRRSRAVQRYTGTPIR